MTWLESIAFILGVANVTLVVRRSLWNYPVALVMVSLYALLFWRERLYSDAALQLFFFALNLYGWIIWRRSVAQAGEVRVERLSSSRAWRMVCGYRGRLARLGCGHGALDRRGDALLGCGQRRHQRCRPDPARAATLENWLLWIVVDLSSIALYAVKGLTLTAILYVIFLGLSLWGYREWRGRA